MPESAGYSGEISEKQKLLMELCRTYKFVLASGPRYSTKTTGCMECIVDHAWRTDRGNIALVAVSQSAGLDSGVWEDLVNVVLPQRMTTGPMKWVKKPFTANVTKKPTCEVSNAFGNRTRIQLDSLKVETEVESRFKNKRYSMLYISELSNFKQRKTFDIWGECLRMLHLSEDQHLFLADTNPADEGEDSWIYHVWYVIPRMSYDEYIQYCRKLRLPVLEERAFLVLQHNLKLLEFEIGDNIFASQNRIDELIARYSHDQDLYDRYILGQWKKASTGAIFADVFKPNIHIIGEFETLTNPDPEILIPESSTWELATGWDPGMARNTAAMIGEKFTQRLTNGKERSVFKALDELAVIGADHSLDEFTEEFVAKMTWWEEKMGRKFRWNHWSDRSVFDMKEPRELKYYHQIIYEASGGLVTLRAADRGGGSVRARMQLMRKLLFEDRFYVSRDRCPMIVEMLKTIRKGSSVGQLIAKGHPMKHIFDALTYWLASECYEEIEAMVFNSLRTSLGAEESGLVCVNT